MIRPSAALLLVLLGAVGCGHGGSSASGAQGGRAGLRSVCPGAHFTIDSLVASDPQSQAVFVDQLERLRAAGTTEVRADLAPLIAAAAVLRAAGRGPNFPHARDGLHAAVVALNAHCVAVGSPILHGGPQP